MTGRRGVFVLLAMGVLLSAVPACGTQRRAQPTPTASPSSTPLPTLTPTLPPPPTATATSTPAPATPSASGPALTEVQFALDIDQTGQLVFPATEFVYGVTRVYVRFAYRGLEDVTEVASAWYLNENLVVSGTLAWSGGAEGMYALWVEDPNGLGRGEWRWELVLDGAVLGGSSFTIGGEPLYTNATWGLSFDPPAGWTLEAEEVSFVTFSSSDQRQGLALRVAPGAASLEEAAAADLAAFQADRPTAEAVATQEVTMGGEKALLQQIVYTDQESGEQLLYLVSAPHADLTYSLWILGPADEVATLQSLLVTTLRSIRFLQDE